MSHTLHTSLEEVILTNLKKSIFQLYEKCKKDREPVNWFPVKKTSWRKLLYALRLETRVSHYGSESH